MEHGEGKAKKRRGENRRSEGMMERPDEGKTGRRWENEKVRPAPELVEG